MKSVKLMCLALLCGTLSCTAAPDKLAPDAKITGVSANSNIEITYTQGRNVSLKVKAPDEIVKNITTTVKDNVLTISYSGNLNGKEIKVELTTPKLEVVKLADNAEFKCNQVLNVKDFALEVHDNGEFKVPGLNGVNIAVSGRDNAEVTFGDVTCDNFAVDFKDNSEFDISSLNGNNMAISASDNSEIEIDSAHVSTLAVSASDRATIEIEGRCSSVAYEASDYASIKAAKLQANNGTAAASDFAKILCSVSDLVHRSQGQSIIQNS